MKKRNKIINALIAVIFFINLTTDNSSFSKEKKPRMAFFYSHHDMFWNDFLTCMKACGDSLGISLQIYCADHSRDKMVSQVREAAEDDNKPDYIIVAPFKGIGNHILKITEEAHIKTFIVNSSLTSGAREDSIKEIFSRGLKPQYFLGELLPGDEDAGYRQMMMLVSMAKNRGMTGTSGRIEAVAINGNIADGAGFLRESGLNRAIAESTSIKFNQLFHAPHWDSSESEAMLPLILKRYPETRIIWCANDGIAMGVLEACRKLKLRPGIDIMVGGIDWSEAGLEAVKKGEMALSFGGHFFDGAWALIVLYDNFYGYNSSFISLFSSMSPITKNNMHNFAPLITKDRSQLYRRINYPAYSKKLNPAGNEYRFSVPKF